MDSGLGILLSKQDKAWVGEEKVALSVGQTQNSVYIKGYKVRILCVGRGKKKTQVAVC